jgi:hypothetical protein
VPEDFGDRLDSHEAILRSLTAMLVKQDGINDRLTAAIERLEGAMDTSTTRMDSYLARMDNYMARMDNYMDRTEGYMRQQEAVNTAVSSTLADIKTLLQRVVRGSGNGREA